MHSGHVTERRERFWLRVAAFAIKRANRAGGLWRGQTKYHYTVPAPPDADVSPRGKDGFGG